MAAPTHQSTTGTSFASATAHACNEPATVNAGDLLLLGFYCNITTATFTTPTGWSIQCAGTTQGTNVNAIVYAKSADGTEGGGTVAVTTSVAVVADANILRITGWGGTLGTDVVSGTPAGGASANPDPPSTSWTWGSLDALGVAFEHFNAAGSLTVSSYPSGYTSGVQTGSMATASKALTAQASPENPGTFTNSGAANWIANTIVIKQASAAPFPPFPWRTFNRN